MRIPVHGTAGRTVIWLGALLMFLASCPGLPAMQNTGQGEKWAILLAGVSGEPALQDRFLKELLDLHSLLQTNLGFQADHISVFFDDPAKNPGLIRHKSTSQELQAVCENLARKVKKEDLVFVFLTGHGNYDGKSYKLNLVGPDPAAEELASMLYSVPAERFIVVNATNCSGASIPAFSRKGKIFVSATKSGMEKNQTNFGRFLIEAFRDNAADTDKDGRVSMGEAFLYARLRVESHYKDEGTLQTEHPVLDDNGDGQGAGNPSPENGDGIIARSTFLDSEAEGQMTSEQQQLAREARSLEQQINALKNEKGKMEQAVYEQRLEELLLRLARVNADIRK